MNSEMIFEVDWQKWGKKADSAIDRFGKAVDTRAADLRNNFQNRTADLRNNFQNRTANQPSGPAPAPTVGPAPPGANPYQVDNLKTHASNLGGRAVDSVLSAFGSRRAQGRLSIRLITNELMKRFTSYLGANNIQEVDAKVISDYIGKYYGADNLAAVQQALQKLTGGNGEPPVGGNGNPNPPPPPVVSGGNSNQQQPVKPQPSNYYGQPLSPYNQPKDASTGAWRPVGKDEIFQPGQKFRMNQTTGQSEVFDTTSKTESLDLWWVMTAVNNMLQLTQRGTTRLNEVRTLIRRLQQDTLIESKIPSLQYIPVEYRDQLFNLTVYLLENKIHTKSGLLHACRLYLPEAFMRKDVQSVFNALAVHLNQSGQASTHRTDRKGQQRTVGFNAKGHENQTSGPRRTTDADIQAGGGGGGIDEATSDRAKQAIIRVEDIEPAKQIMSQYTNKRPAQRDWESIAAAIDKNNGDSLFSLLERIPHMNPAIFQALLYASEENKRKNH